MRSARLASLSGAFLSALALALALTGVGCGGPAKDSKFPPRPEGCDVKVYPETPPMMTENIGTVSAVCGDDVKDEDCLRTLKDETCKLGGDVVWGVADKPEMKGGKKRLSGRAAHAQDPTATGKPAPSGK